ncbi:MAG: DUF6263 family protein [Planctomycetia bacterium]
MLFRRRCLEKIVSSLAVVLLLAGCGGQEPVKTASDDDLLDELLTESEGTESDAADEVDVAVRKRGESALAVAKKGARNRAVSRVASELSDEANEAGPSGRSADVLKKPRGEKLELRLAAGDRFPMIKTVEQTLIQKSETHPAMAKTRLELNLVIMVQEVLPEAILLGVQYSRVLYEHDISGRRILFDSATHQGNVPWDAVPYAGMVGNGFSFWLGRDNTIRELVGYRDFLERCVQLVPLERRQTLLSELSSRFGDDGVANFVDDSIGLLPYDSSVDREAASMVMPGDVWTRERRLMQPVPVYLTSTYRLTDINQATAEIEITGRIASGEAVNSGGTGRVRISGGRSLGHCVVDRVTGLPVDVRLTRNMTLRVETEDGHEVTQEKEILTTIRAFPEVKGPGLQERSASNVRQASDRRTPATKRGGRPVQATYREQ